MAYATRTDLTRHGLSSSALSGVSTTDQDAALDAASTLADSYLRARYATPVVGYSTDLTQKVCALAAWELLRVRGYNPSVGGDEAVRLAHQDAVRWLRDVADGRAHLAGISESDSEAWPVAIGAMSDEARGW